MSRYQIDIVTRVDPFFTAQIFRGIATYAREHGHWDLLSHSHDDPELVQQLQNSEADGIILEIKTPQMARALAAKPHCVVNITSSIPHPHFPSISLDHEAIGDLGARHLLEAGFQDVGYCGRDDQWSLRREAGFVAAASKEPRVRCHILHAPGSRSDKRCTFDQLMRGDTLRNWLLGLPRPIAIMACEDGIAKRLSMIAASIGASIPNDIAVLGVNNHELSCEYSQTPLSSIDPNSQLLGYAAAEMLEQLLLGDSPDPFHRLIPPRDVVGRQSTEYLAFTDADFNEALRFVRLHAHEGIDVDDVLKNVPLSRRSLYRRFQENLGHSPGEEIRRVRLDHAQQLLRDTHMTLIEVAMSSGYADLAHLSRSFKQAFGLTPGQYRRRHTTR